MLGSVKGNTIQTVNVVRDIDARLKTLVGGELTKHKCYEKVGFLFGWCTKPPDFARNQAVFLPFGAVRSLAIAS